MKKMSNNILYHELADMLPEVTKDHSSVLELLHTNDDTLLEEQLESLEVANYCMSVYYGNVAKQAAAKGPLKSVAEERAEALHGLPVRTAYYQNQLGKLVGTFNLGEVVPLRSVLGEGHEDLYRNRNGAFKLDKRVVVTANVEADDPVELFEAASVSHDYHKSFWQYQEPHVLRSATLLGVPGAETGDRGILGLGRKYEYWYRDRVQAINQRLGEILLGASDMDVQATIHAESIHTLKFLGLNIFSMDTIERPQVGEFDQELRTRYRLLGALLVSSEDAN